MDTHSESQRRQNSDKLRNLILQTPFGAYRSKYLPGEGPVDYERALLRAIKSGMTETQFEHHRIEINLQRLQPEVEREPGEDDEAAA